MRHIVAVVIFLSCFSAFGQNLLANKSEQHRFWDKQNIALLSGVAAARIADMDSTWRFRATRCVNYPARVVPNGIEYAYSWCGPSTNESVLSNSFVDNKPAFAAYSIGMVGLQALSSYALHRTGHHRIERISAMVHIGYVSGLAIHNYMNNGGFIPTTYVEHHP